MLRVLPTILFFLVHWSLLPMGYESFVAFAEYGGGFRDVALRWHNYYRQLNGYKPLQLDFELSKLAHAHAERMAQWNTLTPSNNGFRENLWAYKGELRPLARDVEYAIRTWYTGSTVPGNVTSSADDITLLSDEVEYVGFGVGTSSRDAEGINGYTVVVAQYY